MKAHAGTLRMSTVNLTEALVRIRDRQPQLAADLDLSRGQVQRAFALIESAALHEGAE